MDARESLLAQHALLHSATTVDDQMFSYEDRLFEDLDESQLRALPDGLNSIVWTIWHHTRYEDLVVNLLLCGQPEIFDDGWADPLRIDHRQAGTGFGDDEVSDLSGRIDIDGLRRYRAAVGRATREWLGAIRPEALDERPAVKQAIGDGLQTLGARAAWVVEFWKGKTVHELLLVPVIGHGFVHFGEVSVTRSRLGSVTR